MATEAKARFCLSDITAAYLDVAGASEEEVRRVFLRDAAANLHRAGLVFTREDVALLRRWAGELDFEYPEMDSIPPIRGGDKVRFLADRIEALLPPEDGLGDHTDTEVCLAVGEGGTLSVSVDEEDDQDD